MSSDNRSFEGYEATGEALDAFRKTVLERLARATTDDLEAKAPAGDIPDEVADETLEPEEARLKQALDLRKRFFRIVIWALWFVLGSSVAVMTAYIVSQWGRLDSRVMIAWMAAAVVQTIGLAYIVANYLFPGAKTIQGHGQRLAARK